MAVSRVTNRVNVTIVPYILIQSRPRPLNGLITTGNDIAVTANGLGTGTQMSIIMPGTTHPSFLNSQRHGR